MHVTISRRPLGSPFPLSECTQLTIYNSGGVQFICTLSPRNSYQLQLLLLLLPQGIFLVFIRAPKNKEGVQLRPNVSSINSYSYNTARHLATFLSPLFGDVEHHIQNSAEKVRDPVYPKNRTLRGKKSKIWSTVMRNIIAVTAQKG